MLARRHNLRAHFWQSLSNYFQQIVGLILSLILARILTPADFGTFAYVAALYDVFLVLIPCASGMGQILIGDGGKTPRLFDLITALVRRFLIIETACGLALFAYFLIITSFQEAYIAIVLTICHCANRVAGVYRIDQESKGNFKPVFIYTLWSAVLSSCLSVILACNGIGIYSLLAPSAVGAVISIIVFIIFYGRPYQKPHLDYTSVFIIFKSSFWTWLQSLFAVVNSRADRIIVGSEFSQRELGFYNRALNFSPLAYLLLGSFLSNAATSSYARAETYDKKILIFKKNTILVFTFGFLNFIVWFFLADRLVPLLFGSQWIGAIPVFQALSPLSLCLAFRDLPSTFYLGQKKFKHATFIYFLTLLLFFSGVALFQKNLSLVFICIIFQFSLAIPGMLFLVKIYLFKNSFK